MTQLSLPLAWLAVLCWLAGRNQAMEPPAQSAPPAEAHFRWYSPSSEHRVQLAIGRFHQPSRMTRTVRKRNEVYMDLFRQPTFGADAAKVEIPVAAYRLWKRKITRIFYGPGEPIGPASARELTLAGCLSLVYLLERPHSLFKEALEKMKGYLKFEIAGRCSRWPPDSFPPVVD